ncbi:hypothetical protein EV202_101121 [Bacteroides heparinolyticus]|uniref:Uncharacterized protein n=1 Tax=Prevotella heparinolytica TaxID=28113 RepID=A0A4R2LS54_9BACE|nr:hypothetical protein EV202_101121 [Bacteroides heparinolyticus]
MHRKKTASVEKILGRGGRVYKRIGLYDTSPPEKGKKLPESAIGGSFF